MIRYTLLLLVILYLSTHAFKDWYRSLCGLVVLMSVVERYDMPRQMLGITGLNPWNILLLFVLLTCFINARKEQLKWDFPRPTGALLLVFFAVVVIGFMRMAGDFSQLQQFFIGVGRASPELKSYIVDDLLNSMKYALPGLLMFYGCITRNRLLWGISACLLASFILGVQIIKWMPIGQLANAELLSDRALRVLDRAIGYHRVDLAAMMAGASWGFFVVRSLATTQLKAWALTGAGVVLILSLALTGGRTGYGTWLILAIIFTVLRWKRLILLIPVAVMIVIAVVPAVRDRMFYGFSQGSEGSGVVYEDEGANMKQITSDRILIWEIVVDRIGKKPLVGYGRHGHFLSGAGQEMRDTYGERKAFPHPHNAYLELVLDNGLLGAIPIFFFFFLVSRYSVRLFTDQRSKTLMACGGFALASITGQLIASIGGQSFYPRAGVVIMWCSIGLALRAYVFLQKLGDDPTPDAMWEKAEAQLVNSRLPRYRQ